MQNVNQAVQKLEESRSEMEGKWLTFWMDTQLFGVSIAHVEQIVSLQPITQVPEYPAYAKGIINLRGSLIPVVDLRLRLGRAGTAYNDRTCIIIILVEGRQLGFIVDEVDAVLNIPEDRVAPPPQMGDAAANRFLTGVARLPAEDGVNEKIVLCLDVTKVLRADEHGVLQSRLGGKE